MTEEQIKKVVDLLNIAEKESLIKRGYTNEAFFTDGVLNEDYKYYYKTGKTYFYINCGGSGVFMVNIVDGEIFNIKAYGQIDKNKKLKANLGNINNYNTIEEVRILHSKRWNYLR